NAALLATLMMFKAEALDNLGRASEASQTRMDSLAWARYGFGSDQNVRTRLREVAALDPK
ncbi:MAG: ATP-dependent transcriptional regulator, partial [Marivivens sp.]|nr:ATP-dependent transcriptional regulator [Marivivens sp.]